MNRLNCTFKLSALILASVAVCQSYARDKSTNELSKAGKLGISREACIEVESKLGQVLYVNVDGFGTKNEVLAEDYYKMVKDLNIGGVLPKAMRVDFKSMKPAFARLKSQTNEALLVSVDYQPVTDSTGKWKSFGLGYGGGFMSLSDHFTLSCQASRAYLDAFLHRAVGLNHALGPTIEYNLNHNFLNQSADKVEPKALATLKQFDHFGVTTTLKHFPSTPENFNLHNTSKDTSSSLEQVKRQMEIFKRLAGSSEFVMTTHLFNSKVDPDDMATFSKIWVKKLREEVGFKGLLMTDAIFMINYYPATMKKMAAQWPTDQVPIEDQNAIFVARSLLSGHDMVFLEGNSGATYMTFNEVLKIACQDKPISAEIRSRILESHQRVTNWKEKNEARLKQEVKIPDALFDEAVELSSGTDLCKAVEQKKFEAFKIKAEKLGIVPRTAGSAQSPAGAASPVAR